MIMQQCYFRKSAEEQALLAEFERKRKAKSLTLPSDDIQVKFILRHCNQPICEFFYGRRQPVLAPLVPFYSRSLRRRRAG